MANEEKRVSGLLDDLQRQGRYGFDRMELEKLMAVSSATFGKALLRLAAKNRVRRIRRSFHVILPVEYSAVGIIPTDWFLDDLMRFLGLPYYLGLQSAAALYGAAHQQVQQVQVVTPRQERLIQRPGLSIRFFRKLDFAHTPLQSHRGHSGMLPASSPEGTALDLVRSARHIGGLDAVITVLAELAESMNPEKLAAAAAVESELAQVQRLGWLLDQLKQTSLADALHSPLGARSALPRTKLDAAGTWGGYPTQNRWRVVENANPQSDL